MIGRGKFAFVSGNDDSFKKNCFIGPLSHSSGKKSRYSVGFYEQSFPCFGFAIKLIRSKLIATLDIKPVFATITLQALLDFSLRHGARDRTSPPS